MKTLLTLLRLIDKKGSVFLMKKLFCLLLAVIVLLPISGIAEICFVNVKDVTPNGRKETVLGMTDTIEDWTPGESTVFVPKFYQGYLFNHALINGTSKITDEMIVIAHDAYPGSDLMIKFVYYVAPEPEPEPDPEPDPNADPDPQTDPDPEPDPQSDPNLDTDPDPDPQTNPDQEQQTNPDPNPETEPQGDQDTDPEPEHVPNDENPPQNNDLEGENEDVIPEIVPMSNDLSVPVIDNPPQPDVPPEEKKIDEPIPLPEVHEPEKPDETPVVEEPKAEPVVEEIISVAEPTVVEPEPVIPDPKPIGNRIEKPVETEIILPEPEKPVDEVVAGPEPPVADVVVPSPVIQEDDEPKPMVKTPAVEAHEPEPVRKERPMLSRRSEKPVIPQVQQPEPKTHEPQKELPVYKIHLVYLDLNDKPVRCETYFKIHKGDPIFYEAPVVKGYVCIARPDVMYDYPTGDKVVPFYYVPEDEITDDMMDMSLPYESDYFKMLKQKIKGRK